MWNSNKTHARISLFRFPPFALVCELTDSPFVLFCRFSPNEASDVLILQDVPTFLFCKTYIIHILNSGNGNEKQTETWFYNASGRASR